jgi:hypothetical protein
MDAVLVSVKSIAVDSCRAGAASVSIYAGGFAAANKIG